MGCNHDYSISSSSGHGDIFIGYNSIFIWAILRNKETYDLLQGKGGDNRMGKLVTRPELCEHVRMSKKTASKYIKEGMPYEFKIGREYRFDLEKAIQWIKNRNK